MSKQVCESVNTNLNAYLIQILWCCCCYYCCCCQRSPSSICLKQGGCLMLCWPTPCPQTVDSLVEQWRENFQWKCWLRNHCLRDHCSGDHCFWGLLLKGSQLSGGLLLGGSLSGWSPVLWHVLIFRIAPVWSETDKSHQRGKRSDLQVHVMQKIYFLQQSYVGQNRYSPFFFPLVLLAPFPFGGTFSFCVDPKR